MISDIVKNQITVLQVRCKRLGESLEKLSVMDMTTFPKEYEGHTTDAALRAESLTYQLRQLLLITTTVKPEEYYAKANKELGIDVSFADGVLRSRCPAFCPKSGVHGVCLIFLSRCGMLCWTSFAGMTGRDSENVRFM